MKSGMAGRFILVFVVSLAVLHGAGFLIWAHHRHDIGTASFGIRDTVHFLIIETLVIAVAVVAAHRLTLPLRVFAEAADRLGRDVHAPPLHEGGTREVRQAAQAFNRMQQRLLRLIDDRTRTLAAIAHDLRTMLTRLQLRAEWIDDPAQREKALRDLEEMHAMLESTLAFARDDADREERTRFDLAALLAGLVDDLEDAGREARYVGPRRCVYEGRPIALKRAFANLAENAVRYGDEVEIELLESEDSVVVKFSDRGPGISADHHEDVFAPFFRMESSRARSTGGVGLGLTIARSAVHLHGGEIVLAPRHGGGLEARISLPSTLPSGGATS